MQRGDAKKLTKPQVKPVMEESKDEEIIGVKIMSLSEAPANPLAKVNVNEESKLPQQEPLPDPKKKTAVKKAQLHRDEGAFNTYIFRVMKDTLPEEAVSKKAMLTLNHAIADKFEDIMNEARALIVNNKKSTITSKEVETACKLLIPGELGMHAV